MVPRAISELINVSREIESLLARDEQMSSRDIEEDEVAFTFENYRYLPNEIFPLDGVQMKSK